MFIKTLDYITRTIKITNIILSASYHILKYKLHLTTYTDAVVTVCDSLVKHSYIFIKIIQWGIQDMYDDFYINNNDKLIQYFNTFSNNVPYTPLELKKSISCINNAIEYAISRNHELIIENNYIPMNSGSVALIFKARLNNKHVIIKVLRDNIRDIIKNDTCILLHLFDNILIKKIINYYLKLNFKQFINNNRDIFLNQCDFINETNNALLFKKNFKNKKNITIPHAYKHFTDAFREIIVMDYIDGPVAKNVPSHQLKNHRHAFQSFYFESLFLHNILHGDFHLGNIIIINDSTIGVIDFGIVYTLTTEISNGLFDILFLNKNKKQINNAYKAIKIFIKLFCLNTNKHEEIFKNVSNNPDFRDLILNSKLSANVLIGIIKTIMSLENVELNHDICNLFLIAMSGLQTIEAGVKHDDHDKSSLTYVLESYIKKIKIIL